MTRIGRRFVPSSTIQRRLQAQDDRFSASQAPAPRMGYLMLDGWAGRTRTRVEIIGETPRGYRIRAIVWTRLAGRWRSLEPGDTARVPKTAIAMESQ